MTRDELKEIIKECIYELNTTIENVSYVITKEDCWYLDELASIDESVLNESVSLSSIKNKLLGIIRWFIGKINDFVRNIKSALSKLSNKGNAETKVKSTEEKCNNATNKLKNIVKDLATVSEEDASKIKSHMSQFSNIANAMKNVSITFSDNNGKSETIKMADKDFSNKFDSFMGDKNKHLSFE